jgi:hypothetical protein
MKRVAVLTILTAGAMAHAEPSLLTLDDFSSGAYDTGYISADNVGRWVNASTALGGSRYVGLNVLSNPLDNAAKARVRTSGVQDFSLILDPGVKGNAVLSYGQTGLGLDMRSFQDIALDFNTADRDLQVRLTLFGSNDASLKSWVQTYNNVDGSGTLRFGLGDTSSFAKVERITFDFTPKTGADFSLRRATATLVPEPSAMVAVGFGALVLIRRKKKQTTL